MMIFTQFSLIEKKQKLRKGKYQKNNPQTHEVNCLLQNRIVIMNIPKMRREGENYTIVLFALLFNRFNEVNIKNLSLFSKVAPNPSHCITNKRRLISQINK